MDIVTLGAALKGAKSYTDATIAPLLGGVHYRGSVNYFSGLPSNPSEGDAYTVKYSGTSGTTPDGTEYVWGLDTDDNTYKWIGFSPDTYSKAEVDSLLSGKQNTIDSSHKLSADLSSLPSWTAGTATSHSTPAANDTVLQVLQKIDNNQRLDESNISIIQQTIGDINSVLEEVL